VIRRPGAGQVCLTSYEAERIGFRPATGRDQTVSRIPALRPPTAARRFPAAPRCPRPLLIPRAIRLRAGAASLLFRTVSQIMPELSQRPFLSPRRRRACPMAGDRLPWGAGRWLRTIFAALATLGLASFTSYWRGQGRTCSVVRPGPKAAAFTSSSGDPDTRRRGAPPAMRFLFCSDLTPMVAALPTGAGRARMYSSVYFQRPGHWAFRREKRGMIVDRGFKRRASIALVGVGPVSYLLAKEAADQFDSRARRTAPLVEEMG